MLFLDEPTIGLDVSMQATMRELHPRPTTSASARRVLLTSHYMDDVVALCPRVIVIDHGRLIYDGDLRELALQDPPGQADRGAPGARARRGGAGPLRHGGLVGAAAGRRCRSAAAEVRGAVGRMLAALPVADLTVEDPPLEEVMRELFRSSRVAAAQTT